MEKNAILGEILYIGLVYEKTRCKSPGLWKRSYVRNLDKHIELLKKVAKCIQAPFNIENDNMLLEEVLLEIQNDSNLRNYYPLKKSYMLKTQGMIITECKAQNNIIIDFVIRLLDDLLLELRKGFRKDKEKICKMIFSLHNLPRVYLNKDKNLGEAFGRGFGRGFGAGAATSGINYISDAIGDGK